MLMKDLETAIDPKKNEFKTLELINFASVDNFLIDTLFACLVPNQTEVLAHDILAEEELLYHLRKAAKDLAYLIDLPFKKFWAVIIKVP